MFTFDDLQVQLEVRQLEEQRVSIEVCSCHGERDSDSETDTTTVTLASSLVPVTSHHCYNALLVAHASGCHWQWPTLRHRCGLRLCVHWQQHRDRQLRLKTLGATAAVPHGWLAVQFPFPTCDQSPHGSLTRTERAASIMCCTNHL